MESRLQLYNRMLATRDELKEEFVVSASEEIERRALLMEEFRTVRRVGLYLPYGNEVRTDLLYVEGDRNRKELYYPAHDSEEGGLAYYRIVDRNELKATDHGMLCPTGKQSKLRDINTLNTLIVPGIVFDLSGGRIGFGSGFYDSTLERFRGVRIALAYDFQIVPTLPVSASGKKLDWIVTEKRIIRC